MLYALFGALWILLSDRVVTALFSHPHDDLAQSLKGVLFILVTAVLVYLLARQSHDRLRRSERTYRQLFESSPDALFVVGEDGAIHDVNPVTADWYGYSREAFRGMTVADLADPELRDQALDRVHDAFRGAVTFPWRHVTRAGDVREVEIHARPMSLDGETVVLASVRDVTEALRAERRFQTFVESATDIVYSLTPEGVFTYLSPSWQTLMGEPPEAAVGKSFEPYVHPEDVHLCRDFLAGVLEAGERRESVEYRVIRPDGEQRWHLSTGAPLRDARGEVTGYVGIARDVTERRRMQDELRESERRYRELFEEAPVGIFTTTSDGRALDVNPAMAWMLDCPTPDEAVAHYTNIPRQLYADPGRREAFVRALAQHGRVDDFDYEAVTVTGRHAWFTMSARIARRNPDGTFLIEGFTTDISARRQAEEALVASERRYRGIFENAHDAFLVFDLEGTIVDANPRAVEMYGYTRDEFIGLHSRQTVHPDFYHVYEEFARSLRETGAFHGESRDVRKDGAVFDIEVRGARFDTGDGTRLLAFIRDITETKRAREVLEASERKYRTYVDYSPVAIFIADANGRYVDVNEAACALLGYPRAELLGMTVQTVSPEGDRAAVYDGFQTLQRTGRLRDELVLVRRDGSHVHVTLDAVALGDGRYLGFCMDITARRAAEARIEHLNAVLRSLRHVERLMTRERDPARLVQGVCDGLVEARGFHNAWAVLLDRNGALLELASAGVDDDIEGLRADVAAGELPTCVARALESSGPVLITEPPEACDRCRRAGRYEHWSAMAMRLECGGRVFGALVVSVPRRMAGDPEERALFEELGHDVGFALRSLESEEERRAEEEQRRLFERIVAAANAPMAFLDASLCYRAVNDEYLDRFGVSREEIVGRSAEDVLGEPFYTEHVRGYLETCLAGEEVRHEVWTEFPAAGRRCMVMHYHPHRDDTGAVTGVIAIGMDVTEVREAERALRQSEAELLAFFNSTQDAIYLKDTDLRYVRVNHAMEAFLERPADEIVGKDDYSLFAHEEAEEIRRVDLRLLEGEVIRGEYTRHVEGQARHVETVKAPVRDFAGRVVGLCGVTRDISDRRHLEEQLRQAQKMEAVGQLAGGVAHDFNNLLQVINGHTDLMLLTTPEESEIHADLREVAKAGERAARLVGQLLAFSRRQVMQPQDLNLNDVIADLTKMLGRVIGEDVRLDFVPGHRLATVHADRGMMEQVVMNLCVNARDAMPEGGSLIIETENVLIDADYCESHAWARPGRFVLVSITDTGTGMDEATMERVFEPFFTTKELGKGTGLGLATVYGIVRQHEGAIQVYSELGKGTTFKVYVPVSERPAADVGSKVEAAAVGGTETILLAEDDTMVADLARRTLERAGYTVIAVSDGEEAVVRFQEDPDAFDLCLFDVVMPRMSGREAYERIRVARDDVPVLYASGYSENAVHTNFILHEGLSLLQKPFSRDALLRAVRRVLDQPGRDA